MWKYSGSNLPPPSIQLTRVAYSRLQPEEIHRLGTALKGDTANLKWALYFLLLTGARSGVVTNWDPAWIQADHLTIARNTVGIKKEQVILLSPLVKDLLPRLVSCSWGSLRHGLHTLCAQAMIPDLTPHDLRRTYACVGIDIGIPAEVVMALLGHRRFRRWDGHVAQDIQTLMPYAIQISEHLQRLLDGDLGNQQSGGRCDLLTANNKNCD